MTKVNILERRRQRIAFEKSRLSHLKSHVKLMERKARTRRLIELGGLVAKAGLEEWDTNALYGVFLDAKEKERDKKRMKDWAHKGGVAFSKENHEKSPVIVKFESKPNEEIRTKIRELGLKWNAMRGEWQGYVELRSLGAILENQIAEIIKL